LEHNYKKFFFKLSRYYATKRAVKFVLLSKYEADSWHKKYNLSYKKIEIIYNPITIDKKEISVENKFHYKTFLAIGNNIKVKGFDILLDAWKQTQTNWCLKIIGLSEKQKNILIEKIHEEGIKNVQIFSRISNIVNYYKESSVFVLSSRNEASPLVLIESQAFGLPVIAYNHLSSTLEIANNSVMVVDYQDNVKSLNDAMNSIATNKELYDIFSNKSLNNSQNFSQENFVNLWRKLLK
jgi:glycosyltransferase involved in cell wall biosynthesis